MTSPSASATGSLTSSPGFAVQPPEAQQAVRELETAHVELTSIRDEAMKLATINPPSADEVSRDAATVLRLTADGRPGSFVEAANAGLRQINELIDALNRSLEGYRGDDDDAASSFR